MYRLPIEQRAAILKVLCEGMGINAACRVTGASKMTVLKLLADVGEACSAYHHSSVRGLKCRYIECDEVWSFCYAKEKNVLLAKSAPNGAGDAWTWTAIDADTKLMVSYLVADRDAESALQFTDDLRSRIDNETRVQITTDGLKVYIAAIDESFGASADYAQLVKLYGNAPEYVGGRYSPAECTGIKKTKISGKPNLAKVSTSYVERANLTIRMQNRRFTRLTNGFSKKIENHVHAFALFAMHYNFCKIHKTLRVTPAMQAGIADHVWSLEEIAALVPNPVAKKRGPYKKKAA